MVFPAAAYSPRAASASSASSSESNANSANSSIGTNIAVPVSTEGEPKQEPGCAPHFETPQRSSEGGSYPFLQYPVPAMTPLWAAHIGVLRWLDAEAELAEAGTGAKEVKVQADVFSWAVVKCVLDIHWGLQQDKRELRCEDGAGGVLPWREWIRSTDTMIDRALSLNTQAQSRLKNDPRLRMTARCEHEAGRLSRQALNWIWDPWVDSAHPPPTYELQRAFTSEQLGLCNPYCEENKELVFRLAEVEPEERGKAEHWIAAAGWAAWCDDPDPIPEDQAKQRDPPVLEKYDFSSYRKYVRWTDDLADRAR
ncbi:hypothetical protein A1Q1_05206 [Trichosporon asahii var. asahii CBS 2479]|uniref:Uncharacterized protein n=1 Tax=Trichosporon asahii var. asahii (strain ATCC 90039 / CBS 2479 / JCM 2466 / KCTC 7840 / NBRC 103889/ NCYC 2677 / UAMH 7654) TaxID=1186058 RepID=J8QHX6_TRIAS|nr:hypothetical protein A1Q1_05206 [Trichosporon asahii var. asahii CBS 2479]EJT53243.1 hypothetical protein A1Q1_05206 [Trichosporon asahii var. asahii CBS 2479]